MTRSALLPLLLVPFLACAADTPAIQPDPSSAGSPAQGGTSASAGAPGATGQGGARAGSAGSSDAGASTTAGSSGAVEGGTGGQLAAGSSGSSPAGGAGTGGSPVEAGAAGTPQAGAPSAGSSGAAQAGASGASAGAPVSDPTCPAGPGPAMVRIPSPQGSFCLDTLETSQADYGKFLASKLDTKGQPEMCQYNKAWEPPKPDPLHGGGCKSEGWDFNLQTGPADLPMGCVDWCDARAYCAWAGKRLCGKVGGGMLTKEEKKEATASELGYACSQGGKTTYPYGEVAQKKVCEVDPLNQAPRLKLGSSSCHGEETPYAQVYDLVGNLDEWEDGPLFLPEGDSGYSVWAYPYRMSTASTGGLTEQIDCSTNGYFSSVTQTRGIGFRCCAD